MTEAEELELLELEEKAAKAAPAPKSFASPHDAYADAKKANGGKSPFIASDEELAQGGKTTGLEAFVGRLTSDIPFAQQGAAALSALRMAGRGNPMGVGENYRQLRDAEKRLTSAGAAEHKWTSRLGAAVGTVASAAALPGNLLLQGATNGLSDSEGDLTKGEVGKVALDTAKSAALTAVLGKLAEAGASKAAPLLGKGAEALKNLAGRLKVNSLRPTPKVAEAMADLPGGTAAVGRELLDRGIGGLTKKGTAQQVSDALEGAGKQTTELATKYDAAGGAPVSLAAPMEDTLQHAFQLHLEPTTEAAGSKLGSLVEKYQGLYDKPVDALTALALKRKLGREAYGAGEVLKRTGDLVHGDYGQGVMKLERGVDDTLDKALGPGFEQANLTYRRLLGANQAAERAAARAEGNHLGPGLLALEAAHVAGGPGVAISHLVGKYGSQAGARGTYNLGRAASWLAQHPDEAARAAPAVSDEVAALLAALRKRGEAAMSPAGALADNADEDPRIALLRRSQP